MVLFRRFAELHPDGRQLCLEYLDRSQHAADAHTGLMDLWIGFAGWMACVTDAEFDAAMVADISADPRMIAAYEQMQTGDDACAALVKEFSSYWPVYRSQDIVKYYGADYPYGFPNRAAFTATLAADQRVRRSPVNWQQGKVPAWADLISAIYQVRCNLVHGHKSLTRPSDRELVRLSFELLGRYIAGSGCTGWV